MDQSVEFTRDELCIIQQALGLRKMLQINTTQMLPMNEERRKLLRETTKLRAKVVNNIKRLNGK